MLLSERYELLELLGTGAFGQVFRARDVSLPDGADCAIKLLNPELTREESVLQRFKREVLLTRALSHPNIVKVFEFGSHGEGSTQQLYYLVMEYVRGRTLRQLLDQREGIMPFKEGLAIFEMLLSGLQYAHAHGIVHRDLKPENLLIDERNVLKIVDFGAAGWLDQDKDLTKTGDMLGSPAYMAPEVYHGAPQDVQTDLYATGVIAFELVTGVRPKADMSLYVRAKGDSALTIPRGSSVPPWFRTVLKACLAHDRRERIPTVDELQVRIATAKLPQTANAYWRKYVIIGSRICVAIGLIVLGTIVSARLETPLFPYQCAAVLSLEDALGTELTTARWVLGIDAREYQRYLLVAARRGMTGFARRLLERGAIPDIDSIEVHSALVAASGQNDLTMIRLLLAHMPIASGATYPTFSKEFMQSLPLLPTHVLQVFVGEHWLDPNLSIPDGPSLLTLATATDDVARIAILLDAGANHVQMQQERPQSFFCAAIQTPYPMALQLFLTRELSFTNPNYGDSCVVFTMQKAPGLLETVLAAGAGDAKLLHIQAIVELYENRQAALLQRLVDNPRFDIGFRDEKGDSSMHHVAFLGWAEAAKILVHAGSPVLDLNRQHMSALEHALNSGNRATVCNLLEAADIDAALETDDQQLILPLAIARLRGTEWSDLLEAELQNR